LYLLFSFWPRNLVVLESFIVVIAIIAPMEIYSALEKLTVDKFAGDSSRSPVVLPTDTSVRDALKSFCTEKVLSFPIANSSHGADTHGFLDLFDLLAFLLDLWDENEQEGSKDVSKLGEKFLNHTVSDLIDHSDNDVYAAVVASEQAQRLIRLFGLGVHRVALLNFNGTLTNIISQSDVARYLNQNLHLLGDNANKLIKDLRSIAAGDIVTADGEQSALSAFKLLASNLVSAVPIVDKKGVINGTLSLSDLKLLQDDLSPLLLSTAQYKEKQEPQAQIVCHADDTLASVVGQLANSNVHRVWVVDEESKPISVISITNVCEFISQFFPPEEN